MIEVSAHDCLKILVQSDVAPDRSPKTSAIDRDDSDRLSILVEYIDRKVSGVGAVLDVLVLSLETILKLDALDLCIEVTDLLAFQVDGVGFLDVL